MEKICELYQTADWKTEKHVPVIVHPDKAKKGEPIFVRVAVGKDIPHPNTTEHNIEWIELYFHPAGDKYPYLLARSEFRAHGASVLGPNTSALYTEPSTACTFRTDRPGTLMAVSSCNIHGLWSNSSELVVE